MRRPLPPSCLRTTALITLTFLVGSSGCRRAGEDPLGTLSAAADPADASLAGRKRDLYQAALADGDRAFAVRADPAQLAAAIAAYSRAILEKPRDPLAEVRLARAQAFLARAEVDAGRSRDAWQAAARAAEIALRQLSPAFAEGIDRGDDPTAVVASVPAAGAEPLYYLALGTMKAAQNKGYAAVMAVKDGALAMMSRAAELDERLDAAGPHRALGSWRAVLPVAAGGGASAARAHFDRARALAPEDQIAKVSEAETLAVLLQDGARFDALLSEVASYDLSRDPERAPENQLAKRSAATLAQQRAKLF